MATNKFVRGNTIIPGDAHEVSANYKRLVERSLMEKAAAELPKKPIVPGISYATMAAKPAAGSTRRNATMGGRRRKVRKSTRRHRRSATRKDRKTRRANRR